MRFPLTLILHSPLVRITQFPMICIVQFPLLHIIQFPLIRIIQFPLNRIIQFRLIRIIRFPLICIMRFPLTLILHFPLVRITQFPMTCIVQSPLLHIIQFPLIRIIQFPLNRIIQFPLTEFHHISLLRITGMRGNFLPFQPVPFNADSAVSVLWYIFFGDFAGYAMWRPASFTPSPYFSYIVDSHDVTYSLSGRSCFFWTLLYIDVLRFSPNLSCCPSLIPSS